MQQPFIVSVGRSLYVWRLPQIPSSSGTWGRGFIQSVGAIPLGNNWEIAAVIRYEDGLCEDVRFSIVDGTQIGTCAHTGRRIFWRNGISNPTMSTAQRPALRGTRAIPILPRSNGNEEIFMRPPCTTVLHSPEVLMLNNNFESPVVKQLQKRIESLEKVVSCREKQSIVPFHSYCRPDGMEVSVCQPDKKPDRVLQHLLGKMELILERPVQSIGNDEDRNVIIRKDMLKCSVDCSLGEYRDLCLAMKKDQFVSSTFVPDNFGERSTVAVFSCMTIHFLSFGDLCAALGECDEEKLVRSVMKARKRRTRSSPSMIRIIGDAIVPTRDSGDPLYITVGSCLSEKTVSLCKRPVPVIQRQNLDQDETDMGFINELETLTMDIEQIKQAQLLSATPESETRSAAPVNKKGKTGFKPLRGKMQSFQIRWIPQRAAGGGNIIEERSRVLKKAGYLELLLPTVFCYSMSQCDELIAVCKKEFMRTCTQRLSSTY